MTALDRSLLDRLRDVVPADHLLEDPDATERYCHDDAEWAPYGRALAVVRARDADEVQRVVRFCIDTGTPLVPRGAGTGLSGGANAVDGAVVLSLERMSAIVEINAQEGLAVVQPGVVNQTLREACAEQGLGGVIASKQQTAC